MWMVFVCSDNLGGDGDDVDGWVGWVERERERSQYGEVGQPSSGVWRLEKRLQQG